MDYLDQNFKNILRRNGFESLEGLREYPKEHFIKFSNMGQHCRNYIRFDDFLCMDAFRMWIKSKDDLRSYSLEELEEMCPKGIRLFVRLKKLKTIQE